MLEYFLSGDETVLSPGTAGPRRYQGGYIWSHAGAMSLGQSTISPWAGVSTPCVVVLAWELHETATNQWD